MASGTPGGGTPATQPKNLIARHTEPRCKVCQSPYRDDIDRAILQAQSYSSIANHYMQLGVVDTDLRKSIANHAQKHMTMEQAAVREMVEEHAKKMYNDIEVAKGFLLTEEAILETGLAKFWEMMLSGEMQWAPKDAILFLERADKLKERMVDKKGKEQQEVFELFMEVVSKVVPEDDWHKIGDEFRARMEARKPKSLEQLVQLPESSNEKDEW